MSLHLSDRVLPGTQRRSLDNLTDDLDLDAGDSTSKRSAFWTMLTLSAVIATAGVLSDSTATVIGAMIIAPLSTPIMGVALGIAKRNGQGVWRAARFVMVGSGLVVLFGVAFTIFVPSTYDLLSNSQISGRTSPGFLDLIAAIATGFAGAVALARKDVAAVLPGVAIAISLVPPLAVVGVCLGQGSTGLAAGALLLFASNLLALVLAGTLVYTVLGYTGDAEALEGMSPRKAYYTLALLLVLVAVPLVGNTVANYMVNLWSNRVHTVSDEWVSQTPGARVLGVDLASNTAYIEVESPSDLPAVDDLLTRLEGQIPSGFPVVVNTSRGEQIEAGKVGG